MRRAAVIWRHAAAERTTRVTMKTHEEVKLYCIPTAKIYHPTPPTSSIGVTHALLVTCASCRATTKTMRPLSVKATSSAEVPVKHVLPSSTDLAA